MLDMTKMSTEELRVFVGRKYTSSMERALINAAMEELRRRAKFLPCRYCKKLTDITDFGMCAECTQ